MQKYKAIISDFDQTLVLHDLTLHSKIIQKVQLFISKGYFFTIASGRGYFGDLQNAVKNMGILIPVIIRNGAEIIDPIDGKIIFSQYIKSEIADSIIKNLLQKKVELYVEKGAITYSVNAIPGNHAPNEIYKNIILLQPENIPKILIKINSRLKADVLRDEIMNEYDKQVSIKINTITNDNYAIDINSKNISKSNAVRFVIEHLGLQKKQVVAVGDNANDIELFSECGFKVAMGNAVPELKTQADLVTDSVNELGIIKVIDYVLNINNSG